MTDPRFGRIEMDCYVRSSGKRLRVSLRHVSRETLNGPRGHANELAERRKARRKRRMRLRKLRGWH